MFKKHFIVAGLTLLVLAFGNPAQAQISGGTNGLPVVATGTTTGTSSPAYIDAYIQTGGSSGSSDVCLRIQSVYNNASLIPAGTSATVDARGFTTNNAPSGGWVCTVNPFANTANTALVGKSGKLLLGYIDIPAQVTWVIPSRIILQGIGANGTGVGGPNTVIHASSTFSDGLGSALTVLQMGLGGTSPDSQPASYGIQIRDLTVDCNNVAGTTGILNNNSEEASVVNNVEIFDCPVIGLHVTTNNANSTGFGAVNSGPYEDVDINYTSDCSACGGTTVALQVDGVTTNTNTAEGRSIRGFDNVTVSGNNLSSKPSTLIVVYGVSTAITNSHVEYCSGTSACVQIGQTGTQSYSTYGVILSDVTVGVNNGGYDVEIFTGTTFPTGNILIENLNHESTGNTNTLKDNVTGNTVSDIYLGWYFLGAGTSPAVFTSSNGTITDSLTVPGNVNVGGTLTKHSGTFRIDHPLDPANEYLSHSFVESPDMMNIYNGSVTTDRRGMATVILPAYFEALNRDFRYQLTPVGQFAQAFVAEKVKGNRFVIKTSKPGVEVSWQVTGVRHDEWANQHRVQVEEPKPAPRQN